MLHTECMLFGAGAEGGGQGGWSPVVTLRGKQAVI